MAGCKIITVYGATGAQGGSVISSLLQNKDGAFSVRGLTRNAQSDKAKSLHAQGVEVVQADGFDKADIVKAFTGSWGVFINTNSDDPTLGKPGAPTETELGMSLVDAAAEAGVKHLVYSGLASATIISDGTIPSACFDGEKYAPIAQEKHAISEYAKSKAALDTVTILSPGWYSENHLLETYAPALGGFPFFPDEEGYLTLRFPLWGGTNEIPFISILGDYGDLVHGVFLSPEKYNRRFIQGISTSAKPEEFIHVFEKVIGKKARFVPVEDWRTLEDVGGKSMKTIREMCGFCQYSGGQYYNEPNDTAVAEELKAAATRAQGDGSQGHLTTFEEFFSQHKDLLVGNKG